MSTVFVSGGSGFLGSKLLPSLVSAGHRVRALARSAEAERAVATLGAEAVGGDLGDVTALTAALGGCEYVIHAAARRQQGGSAADYHRDNLVGTQNMVSAAEAAGVRRFVLVGAAMCLLGGRPVDKADESWPLNEPRYSAYASTKTLADRAVRAANREKFTTCVVRPGWIWGPGDPQAASVAAAATSGRMRLIDGGRYPIVTSHVDNTVHAIHLALARGAGGEAYYVFDDGVVQLGEFIAGLLGARGLEAPTKSISRRTAWIAGSVMDAAWTVLRRPGAPPLSRLMVALNGGPFVVSDDKARVELGYEPVISRAEGMRRLREAESSIPGRA
jgi:nucleoside-diphosphate-sugar epimerase